MNEVSDLGFMPFPELESLGSGFFLLFGTPSGLRRRND